MSAPTLEVDLTGLPMPDELPPEGSCVSIERPEDGLAVLRLVPPHRPKLAVLDLPLMRDLARALAEVGGDTSLRGLVISGREPLSFAGGADVEAIKDLTDEGLALRVAQLGQAVFEQLARLGKTRGGRLFTVAAVGGPVPGGACELSLSCDRILLADHPSTRIGLPEVLLGILPGWGGCQRLPRRIGVPNAIQAILTGTLFDARRAKSKGIVDRVVAPEHLLEVAADVALGRKSCKRRSRGLAGLFVDRNPLFTSFAAYIAKKEVRARTHGHYPAPLQAIDITTRAPWTPIKTGLAREAKALSELSISPVCKSLVRVFFAREEAKKLGRLADGSPARTIERAGVVGAGVMGAAIAGVMAERGIRTRLSDMAREPLDAALQEHRRQVERKRKRRRYQRHQAEGALDRLSTGIGLEGLGRAQLVIEAVAERMDVKHAVFGELAKLVPEDAILATNTSSLSVDAMAAAVPNPERFVGIHFFNPVRKMPLVEIVRGEHTSDEVVAAASKLALDMGKTPVVCKDVAGFLVNRLLGPYLDEAVRLFEEGADPLVVDQLALDFGMPMGPFELLDEVGLDIAGHAALSLEEAYGERMTASRTLQPLVEAGELGKKTEFGIHAWARGKQRGKLVREALNARLAALSRPSVQPGEDEVRDRLILAMVNEAARALEEGVVTSATELDLASIFGMGFAPFRGGLLRYADTRGVAVIRDRLAQLADSPAIAERTGGRAKFTPAAEIERLARSGESFHPG